MFILGTFSTIFNQILLFLNEKPQNVTAGAQTSSIFVLNSNRMDTYVINDNCQQREDSGKLFREKSEIQLFDISKTNKILGRVKETH